MLDLHHDARLLEPEPVGRCEDVAPPIGTRRRHLGAIAHGAQHAGHQFLHFVPVERVHLILDAFQRQGVQASEPDLRKRIAALQDQLSASSLAPDEERQLQKALAEYVETSNRARRLEVRRNSLEATLVGLPDKLEEVYQLVMAAPFSTEMGSKIEESLSRLRIAEEVSAEFNDADLFSLGPPSSVSSVSTVTPLAAARRNQRAARN